MATNLARETQKDRVFHLLLDSHSTEGKNQLLEIDDIRIRYRRAYGTDAPPKSISQSLSRLKQEGKVVSPTRGVWGAVDSSAPQPATRQLKLIPPNALPTREALKPAALPTLAFSLTSAELRGLLHHHGVKTVRTALLCELGDYGWLPCTFVGGKRYFPAQAAEVFIALRRVAQEAVGELYK